MRICRSLKSLTSTARIRSAGGRLEHRDGRRTEPRQEVGRPQAPEVGMAASRHQQPAAAFAQQVDEVEEAGFRTRERLAAVEDHRCVSGEIGGIEQIRSARDPRAHAACPDHRQVRLARSRRADQGQSRGVPIGPAVDEVERRGVGRGHQEIVEVEPGGASEVEHELAGGGGWLPALHFRRRRGGPTSAPRSRAPARGRRSRRGCRGTAAGQSAAAPPPPPRPGPRRSTR